MKRRGDTSSAIEKGPIDGLVRDTVAALKEVRGDVEATKEAWFQYFRQSLAAKLTVEELDRRIPEIAHKVRYTGEQSLRVLSMIRGMYAINFGDKPSVRVESNESIFTSEGTDGAVETSGEGENIQVA